MSISVGIDIGASAVRIAVLRVAYRKTTLEALVSADVTPEGGIAEAIRAAYAQAVTAGKPADGIAVAIDGVRASVHTLALPASAQKQFAEVLPFELEAALPVDMSESVFDYRVLDAKPHGIDPALAAVQVAVLALVARTEDVRARIELVKGALGQEPERVGAGALPLASLIGSTPTLAEPGTSVIVDLGIETTEVLVVADGEPRLARTLSWGTKGLPGTAPRLARELRLTIGAFRASGGEPPTRLFLCGTSASGAETFFAGELGLPVEMLPPVAVDMTPLAGREAELPLYAMALGLALGLGGRHSLDLRRGALSYERGFAWVRDKIPVLAGLAAVIVVSFLFSAYAQLYAANKDQTALEAALGVVSGEVLGEETTSAARAQELVSQQSGGAGDDPMPHVDAFDVMVKLSEDISQSTVHDVEELDVQKQHATVHGIVGTIPEAQSIKTSLETERCFKDVNVSRFNKVVGGERQKYVLDIDLRCDDDVGKKPKKSSSSGSGGSSGGGE
jgi:general secretion pathway protein L